MTTDKKILDACCGNRMMWFDKADPDTIYMDIRDAEFIACDGRRVRIHPDLIADFRDMPFDDCCFKLVVFDPPHFNRLGVNSYTAQKYGRLFPSWETGLKQGFDECMRVLEPFGILIFKWNESQIPVSRLLEIFGQEPLFGHRSGKASKNPLDVLYEKIMKNKKQWTRHYVTLNCRRKIATTKRKSAN